MSSAPAPKPALVADLFCGAGGSSTGAKRALARHGIEMKLVAVNHWSVAIETHQRNHPEARHYCQDVNVAKPAELVPEGKLDLLMASPTCTFHSRARGGKPINDQGRMDPWAIVHWCTELRVKRLIVENVPEFVEWGPLDLRTGRPIKRRRGEYFRAWTAALAGAGFRVEWRVLNAADFGDATTRSRFFLLARSDGKRIDWPEPTHSRDGADLFGSRPKWRAAREVIDWSLRGRSIFDRKRPLSPKTLNRIYAGAIKLRWPDPFLVILRNHMGAQSIDEPLPTVCASGNHVYLAEPLPFTLSNQNNGAPRSIESPLPTITTGGAANEKRPGCARPAVVEPIIFQMNQGGERTRNIRSAADPLCTITATGTDLGLVEPFILNRHGDNGSTRAHEVDAPVPTADCRGAGYLVEPFIATLAHGSPAHERNPDARRCRSLDEPLQTIHAGGNKFAIIEPLIVRADQTGGNGLNIRSVEQPVGTVTGAYGGGMALVEPFVLSQASGGAPRGVDEPVPTITSGGAHALIAPYYGEGSGLTCGTVEQPLPTVTTKARFGLVVPVTHGGAGGPVARSTDAPLPTMTTAKGGEFALVMPVTHGDDAGRVRSPDEPLPTVTGAHRGELALIAAAFGEREGQAPRVHSIDEPVPTICATGRIPLAQAVTDGREFDILFRMLEPRELARAMGFDEDEIAYEFMGTKTQVTKQIGNAVPVNTAAALVGAIMAR